MKVRVYSLTEIMYEGEAKLVNVKTGVGEATILDNHMPYLATLAENGSILVTNYEGLEKRFSAGKGGFMQVSSDNKVTVLVN